MGEIDFRKYTDKYMNDSITVAVLDFGSFSLKAAQAERYGDGKYRMISYAVEPSEGSVVRGKILNLNDVASKVQSLLKRLEAHSGRPIRRVYAAVGGQSLQSYSHVVEQVFDEPHEITSADLDELQEQVENFQHANRVVLAEVSPTYYINGSRVQKPVGVQALNLRVEYQLILADEELSDNIDQVIEGKLGLEVVGLLMSPIVLADSFLTEEQKRIGSAIVDFGAACTTISVYRRGVLEVLRVLPLGSHNITTDLTWMHISPDEAERVKCFEASILPEERGRKEVVKPIEVKSADMMTIKEISRSEANQYVRARAHEIVANIQAIIQREMKEVALPGGVVITGGGSKLKGLPEMVASLLDVEIELVTSLVSRDRANEYFIITPEWHVLYSMIPYATESCDAEVADETTEVKEEDVEGEEEFSSEEQSEYPEDQLDDQLFQGTKQAEITSLFSEDEMAEQEEKVSKPVSPYISRSQKKEKKKQSFMKRGFFKDIFSSLAPSDIAGDSYDED